MPHWHEEFLAREEAPVLVLFDGWTSLFPDRVVPWRIGIAEKARRVFETEIVPRFIEPQRWYAAKGEPVARAALIEHGLVITSYSIHYTKLYEYAPHAIRRRDSHISTSYNFV